MTWMAKKLGKRLQIQTASQTPASSGALELSYTTLKTVWAAVKPITRNTYAQQVRGVNTSDEIDTHVFTVRSSALYNLGREFGRAFATGFDNIDDLNMIKSNYFLFLESGSSVKGRRFRIKGMQIDEARGEYIQIYSQEIEEEGTGWPK
jgi:head-tail adaptor